MSENPLFPSIAHLADELRGSLTFILGIYESLDHNLPGSVQELWTDLGRISEQILMEIEDHMGAILANIDSYSPEAISARMGDLAGGWEKEATKLSLIADKISDLHLQLEDAQLNTLLNEYLPSSVRGFGRIVSFVRQIRPEDLSLN